MNLKTLISIKFILYIIGFLIIAYFSGNINNSFKNLEKQNEELNLKVSNSNDAIINLLTHYINEPFVCLEVRKMHSQRNRLKNKYKSKFTNNLIMF